MSADDTQLKFQIEEQEARITLQRHLIKALKMRGLGPHAEEARVLLGKMLQALARLHRQERLENEPLDEKALDSVMRDCPL
jgi:hypothetical protein